MKKSVSITCLLGAMMWGANCAAQAVVVANFAADFSTTSSTSGSWQYGAASSLGGTFYLDSITTLYGPAGEVVAWSPTGTYWPTIGLNTGAAAVNFGGGNVVHLAPQQGLLHPGQNGEFAVARLTVASTFTGKLDVEFVGIDDVSSTTDVHVLRNGVSLFSGLINGFGQMQSFQATQAFQAGDVIDFAVGRGINNNFNDDSTGFKATLSTVTQAVPEPATSALLWSGLLAIVPVIARRRKTSARG